MGSRADGSRRSFRAPEPPGGREWRPDKLLRRILSRLVFGAPVDLPGPLEGMIVQRLARGRHLPFHAALGDPAWLPASRDAHMQPDDTVLGLTLDGRAWALPWWIMKNHHVANLGLDGRPIMVVLCEACAGAAAFDAVLDGRHLTFHVEGKYRATHILIDEQTGSLWAPISGEALYGPRRGARLHRLPLYQCTWQEWKTLHAETRVPDGAGESRDGHGANCPTPENQVMPPFVGQTRLLVDDRLDDLELVLGVEADGHARAYPLAWLHRLGPVLNDTLGETEVVILTKPGSWLSVAFARRLDDRVLVFHPTDDPTHVADVETGSRWNLTGTAVAGPLTGRALRFVPSGLEKWYAWSSSHPTTEIHQPA